MRSRGADVARGRPQVSRETPQQAWADALGCPDGGATDPTGAPGSRAQTTSRDAAVARVAAPKRPGLLARAGGGTQEPGGRGCTGRGSERPGPPVRASGGTEEPGRRGCTGRGTETPGTPRSRERRHAGAGRPRLHGSRQRQGSCVAGWRPCQRHRLAHPSRNAEDGRPDRAGGAPRVADPVSRAVAERVNPAVHVALCAAMRSRFQVKRLRWPRRRVPWQVRAAGGWLASAERSEAVDVSRETPASLPDCRSSRPGEGFGSAAVGDGGTPRPGPQTAQKPGVCRAKESTL
jgi:hypothetical protein